MPASVSAATLHRPDERHAWGFIALAALVLAWAALWNGYPILFSDSGTYIRAALERRYYPDRPIFYSLFILPFHLGLTLWPIVAAQCIAAAWVIERATALLPDDTLAGRGGIRIAMLAVLAFATGLPWSTGQVSPDFLAPLLVLCLLLLLLRDQVLGTVARLACALVLLAAQAAHFAHIPLAIGVCIAILVLAALTGARVPRRAILLVAATSLAAIAAVVAVNYAALGTLTFSPVSSVLLLGRLVQSGTAQQFLATACETASYGLCAYRAELPNELNAFFFDFNGTIAALGGPLAFNAEAGQLVRDILADSPWRHLGMAIQLTVTQFFHFATGWGLIPFEEERSVVITINRHFAHEAARFMASRQQTNALHFDTLNFLHVPMGFLLLAASAAALVLAVLWRRATAAIVLATVFLALAANAFLGGALSAGEPRYQNRMIPLLAVALAIAAIDLRAARSRLTGEARRA